jgi:hypothetical protein
MRSGRIVLDCAPFREPNAGTIGHLARQCVAAHRCDCELELRDAQASLLELIDFAGLAEVLRVEVERHSEEREHPLGVEEEGELGDPAAG